MGRPDRLQVALPAARIHTSCAVVSAPTRDLAFARWCFTVECDRPSRWAAGPPHGRDRPLPRAAACDDPVGDVGPQGRLANQLRHPGEARFTEDVDLRIDAGIDAASGMVAAAIGHVLDDPFTYELPAPPRRLPGPPGGGLRFVVVARIAGAELVRFKLDISSRDVITGELERHPSDPVVDLLGLAGAWFPVYPVAQQFAEKLHAYTLPRDVENTRAKDLADMVWLMRRHAFSSDALSEAATATFARRASHAWPQSPPSRP